MLEVKLPTVKRPAGSFTNHVLAAKGALVLTSHARSNHVDLNMCSQRTSYKSINKGMEINDFLKVKMLNDRV